MLSFVISVIHKPFMLSVVMPNVVMLSVLAPQKRTSLFHQRTKNMLNVIMPNVVMLSVLAPQKRTSLFHQKQGMDSDYKTLIGLGPDCSSLSLSLSVWDAKLRSFQLVEVKTAKFDQNFFFYQFSIFSGLFFFLLVGTWPEQNVLMIEKTFCLRCWCSQQRNHCVCPSKNFKA